MESLFSAAKQTVQYVLGSPHTLQNHGILGTLALLSALFLYGRMAELTDMRRTSAGFVLIAVLAGFLLTLTAMVVADFFLVPRFFPAQRGLALIAATVVGALALASPLLARLHRGPYGSAALSWCTALAVAAFMVVIARAGMEIFESGERQGARVRARSQEMQSFLEGE